MKRYAAHYLYCSSALIVSKGVVELDAEACVQSIFTLNDYPEETHSTEFYNGIIIPDLLTEADLKNLCGVSVFENLALKFSLRKLSIAVGSTPSLFVLEHVDMLHLCFTSKTTLRKL